MLLLNAPYVIDLLQPRLYRCNRKRITNPKVVAEPPDTIERERLLSLLDSLPLATAQAGAYLQESGVGFRAYFKFYEQ